MKDKISIILGVVAIIVATVAVANSFGSTSETVIKEVSQSGFELGDNSVTTSKISDGTITDSDINESGISRIADVNMEDLGSDVVAALAGAGVVTEGSITSFLIADGTIVGDDIDSDAVGSDEIVDGSITSDELADDSITTDKIKDKAVTSAKIANGSLIIDKFADGVLTWNNIEDMPYRVVAAGVINPDGTIENSYRVKTCFWNSTASYYKISIIGEAYDHDKYITMISSSYLNWDVFATTGGGWDGKLGVRFYDVSMGVCVQHGFHFIVYDFGW